MRSICFLLVSLLLVGCHQKINIDKEFSKLQQEAYTRTNTNLSFDLPECKNIDKQQHIQQMISKGITRNDAIYISIINNKALQATLEKLGVAKADLIQASLYTNPVVYADFLFFSKEKGFDFDIKWLQSLTDLWQVPLNKRIFKDELDIAILFILEEVIATIQKTRKAYDEVLINQAKLKNYRKILAQTTHLKQIILKNNRKNNLTKKQNIYLSDIAIAEWQMKVIEAQANLEIADILLKKELGLVCPNNYQLILTSSFEDFFINLPTLKVLEDMAICSRPDILAQSVRIKRFEDTITYEKSRILKDWLAGVSVANEFNEQISYGPSFKIDVPIFDQNQAQVAKNIFLLNKSKKDLIALQIEARSDVFKYYTQLQALQIRAKIFKEKIIQQSQELIDLGLKTRGHLNVSQVNLLQSPANLYSLTVDYLNIYHQALNTLSDLEKSIGQRLDLGCK